VASSFLALSQVLGIHYFYKPPYSERVYSRHCTNFNLSVSAREKEEGSGGGLQLYFVFALVISLEWEELLGICMSWPQAAEYKMITNKQKYPEFHIQMKSTGRCTRGLVYISSYEMRQHRARTCFKHLPNSKTSITCKNYLGKPANQISSLV
jgi:hypothetical protein